jgi:hypothetical protein
MLPLRKVKSAGSYSSIRISIARGSRQLNVDPPGLRRIRFDWPEVNAVAELDPPDHFR